MSTKLGAIALLQARVLGDLARERRSSLVLVVVRGKHLQRRVELQDAVEQAVVERVRIARRQVGAARGADQQRVAREQPVADVNARRVARVTRRVDDLQAQVADREHVAVVDAQRRVRRRGERVHDDGHVEPRRELVRGREVIGMRVRVDEITNAQPVAGSAREIAVDLPQLRDR